MTLDQIWKQLIKKHPDLQKPDKVICINPENMYKLLKQVYEAGEARATRTNNFMEEVFKRL